MPFIPHTQLDIEAMLAEINVSELDTLFDEIPAEIRNGELTLVPPALNEMELLALFRQRSELDGKSVCFIGAGAYDHHIPAAVWDITQRGEFLTAYTPYQAEASQGTLQLIYEYQSMITELTGMDVSNASVYDGASGMAEAVLMAVRANKKNKSRRILICGTVHPLYREATQTIVKNQDIQLDILPCAENGRIDVSRIVEQGLNASGDAPAAIVIQQPNFFGQLEDVDALSDWASTQGTLIIAVVNPISLVVLKPPSSWGEKGADIVCGDGQPLGIPLASGGPYFGFMSCRQAWVRQMPGRIIGRTVDLDGNPGFTLTLQAREQHIRRSKATSNICTNQGLLVTAATIHMSLLGSKGLSQVAAVCRENTTQLLNKLTALEGVTHKFSAAFFHETVIQIAGRDADEIVKFLASKGILAGVALGEYYPELADCILFCATEKRTEEEMLNYQQTLKQVLV